MEVYGIYDTERGLKHFRIAASTGEYIAMHSLQLLFEGGDVRRDLIDSSLTAYNNSCAARSEVKQETLTSVT